MKEGGTGGYNTQTGLIFENIVRETLFIITVRLRTARTRGCVSRTSLLTMVYKLGLCAEQNWRRLRGFKRLADVIGNVKFIDGVKEEETQQQQRQRAA